MSLIVSFSIFFFQRLISIVLRIAYIHNNFDQFNGPTLLMPYGSATTTKDTDADDADGIWKNYLNNLCNRSYFIWKRIRLMTWENYEKCEKFNIYSMKQSIFVFSSFRCSFPCKSNVARHSRCKIHRRGGTYEQLQFN